MKNVKRYLSIMLAVAMTTLLLANARAHAATRLSTTKKTIDVGKTATIKIKGAKKSVKWSASGKVVKILKKDKKSAKIKALKAGSCDLKAKTGGKTYKCRIIVKKPQESVPTKEPVPATTAIAYPQNTPTTSPDMANAVTPIETPSHTGEPSTTIEVTKEPGETVKPSPEYGYVSDFDISKQEIYNGNDVSISVSKAEKTEKSVDIEFICSSASEKDYAISAHEYAINGLMAGGTLYGSDVKLPAGKNARFSISIEREWFEGNNISVFKKLDIMFWAYYDNFKDWESETISISTTNDDGTGYYMPDGNSIYSDENMELYYVSKNGNSYNFCLKNKTQSEKRWTIENCSVNGWAYDLGSCKYDLYSEPILSGCYSTFELIVDDDFLEDNSISDIKNIEFDIEFEYDIKSDNIKLDL